MQLCQNPDQTGAQGLAEEISHVYRSGIKATIKALGVKEHQDKHRTVLFHPSIRQ